MGMRMSPSVLLITLIFSLLAVPASWAQQPPTKGESVKPGINDRYLSPEMKVAEWVERFEGESREIFVARQAITEAVQLKPGVRIADVGAGTGLFTALFAQQVGMEGQVYAVDLAPKFVEHLRDRAAEKGLGQITVVLAQEDSITLPKDSIDIAFVCDVLPHSVWKICST